MNRRSANNAKPEMKSENEVMKNRNWRSRSRMPGREKYFV